MALYTFTPFLVLDAQGEPADGAAGQVYALSDTSFETPLDVTDLNGLPLSLTTSADGIVPAFRVEHTEPSVVWKSGGAPTSPMISIEGILEACLPIAPGSPVTPSGLWFGTAAQMPGSPDPDVVYFILEGD